MSDLSELTFLLVARFDSIQRMENSLVVSEYLHNNFKTNIILWEFDSHKNDIFEKLCPVGVEYKFCKDDDPIFHRTKHLNRMLEYVETPFVAVWDVDVIASKHQIYESYKMLKDGADFVYPYQRYFLDTSDELRNEFITSRDIDVLEEYKAFMTELYPPNPVGGAFLANTRSYLQVGGENELFYGWGIEDGERYGRWILSGMNVQRVDGPLFHLSHPRGLNSFTFDDRDSLIKNRIRILSTTDTNGKTINP